MLRLFLKSVAIKNYNNYKNKTIKMLRTCNATKGKPYHRVLDQDAVKHANWRRLIIKKKTPSLTQ